MKQVGTLTAVVLLGTLLMTVPANATPVTPTDLDAWIVGAGLLVAGPTVDFFDAALPPPATIGSLANTVYFDGFVYTYVHTVTPTINNISEFNTAFSVTGFTGTAGWSYTSAAAAGGAGDATDFAINHDGDGSLDWETLFGSGEGWDAAEPITFFFVSTIPPKTGNYQLIDTEIGTAQSYAPVPEPGSLMLMGTGLLGFANLLRRKFKST